MSGNHPKTLGKRGPAAIVLALATLLCSPGAEAQFNNGGTGVLGNFSNATLPTVTSVLAETCSYNLVLDLAQGKAFGRPFRKAVGGNVACEVTLVDINSQVFQNTPPAGSFADGVMDVANFTLSPSVLSGASIPVPTMEFLPNANNTPVIIRATGNITINSGATLSLAGKDGTNGSGFALGRAGEGGPGGYRGGDGGIRGNSPSGVATAGSPGSGPGGGAGGAVNASGLSGKLLTTGATIDPDGPGPLTAVPAGNDLLTLLRGGSGGGGGGGSATLGGDGGAGGGGAILLTANNSVTINGTVTARGGNAGCCSSGAGGGSGGVIRVVANSILGSGQLAADPGSQSGGTVPDKGIVRIEAFTFANSGSFGGSTVVIQSLQPGSIIVPGGPPPAFLRFAAITEESTPTNTVPVPSGTQTASGRTGLINPPDVSLSVASTSPVTVVLNAGPNNGTNQLNGKVVTLRVAPVDTTQGAAVNKTATLACPAAPANCTASVTGVTLPQGLSAFTAFMVVNINDAGLLSNRFPKVYRGEPIESVRLESGGRDTRYVLIAKSGREFPYQPTKQ